MNGDSKTRKVISWLSWIVFVLTLVFVGYLFHSYFSLGPKWGIWINSETASALMKLIFVWTAFLLFEAGSPGNTIGAIMTNLSTPEDRKNAVYLLGTVFLGICYVIR